MKNSILSEIRPALASTLILAVVCCGAYPLAVTGISRLLFKHQADGSLFRTGEGVVRGSSLIGQNFSGDAWFHPRPSAAGANGYDATASGGANLGPTSRKLADHLKERVLAYRSANGLPEADAVPADAVTASGSGLDPHISPRNAALQAPRVAKARGLDPGKVMDLVRDSTIGPDLGFLGDPAVNVLRLNAALEELSTRTP